MRNTVSLGRKNGIIIRSQIVTLDFHLKILQFSINAFCFIFLAGLEKYDLLVSLMLMNDD